MPKAKPEFSEVEAMVEALGDDSGTIRKKARKWLVELGSSATPLLIPLLSEENEQTRWEAAKALGEIADPAAIMALLGALEDDNGDVRWLAAVALIAIGPPATEPLLKHLIDRVDSPWVRQGAHHVLAELRRTEIGDEIAGVYIALGSLQTEVEVIAAADQARREIKKVD